MAAQPQDYGPTGSPDLGGGGGSPQQGNAPEGSINGGINGGGTVGAGATRAQAVRVQADPTLDLIGKYADGLLDKQLQKAKTAAFVSGMQQAMQGTTIQEIADQQPWYTRIFGQSDAVEGARQFLGNTRAQAASIAMVDDMPKLRSMDSGDANTYFQGMVSKAMTGDPAADAAIMQGFQRTLPTLMRQQVKENYAYKQERANAAQSASFMSGAENIQKLGAQTDDDIFTQGDLNVAKSNWIASALPVDGQDEKAYLDARMDNIINMAKAGQFHAVNALSAKITDPATGKESSFLDIFKPDQRAQIDQAIERGAQASRLKYSQDWIPQLSKLEALAQHPETEGVSANDVLSQVAALNDQYRKQTGSPTDLIPPSTAAQYGKQAQGAIIEERMREARQAETNNRLAATAEAKAAAAAQKVSTIDQTATTGDLYALATEPGYGKEAIDHQVLGTINGMISDGRGQQAQNVLWTNYSKGMYVVKPVAEQLDGMVISSVGNDKGPTNGFLTAYARWKAFNSVSPDFAAAYFPQTGARMASYDQAMTASSTAPNAQGQSPLNADAFQASFGKGFKNGDVSDKDAKAAMKAVIDSFPTTLNNISFGWLGGTTLSTSEANNLANRVAVAARPYIPSQGLQGAMQRALTVELTSGRTTILGSHVIGDQNPQQTNLNGYFSKTGPKGQTALPSGETFGTVFDSAVKSVLSDHIEVQPDGSRKEVPGVLGALPTDNITIGRAPDGKGGEPIFLISSPDGKGNVYHAVMHGNDVWKLAQQQRDREAADKLQQLQINDRIARHVR
jgi:hypothetical protein